MNAVAFSPDGDRALTGSEDKTARLWDTATGKELRRFDHSGGVEAVAFSPDGKHIVTGTKRGPKGAGTGEGRIWDAVTGDSVHVLPGHSDVTAVAYSSDGKTALTGSKDQGTAGHLWDTATGESKRILFGQNKHIGVSALAFSPDSALVLTGSTDHRARLLDARTGEPKQTFMGHNGPVHAVAFSADGRRVLTGGGDHTARLWDAATGKELLRLVGHKESIVAVAFSPDGRLVATGSKNKAHIWEVETGRPLVTPESHAHHIIALAVSADGRRVVTGSGDRAGSGDKAARLWDGVSGRGLFLLSGHKGAVTGVAFSRDGKLAATGSADRLVRVWDADTGRLRRVLHGTRGAAITSVAFAPDDRRLVVGRADSAVLVWDADSGKEVLTLAGPAGPVTAVAISGDGKRVVTGHAEHTALVWDAKTGEKLQTVRGADKAPVSSVAISADGKLIATGTGDRMAEKERGGENYPARLWDAATGKEVCALEGHAGHVFAVAISPDGRQIATGGGDKDRTVRLWDATGKAVRVLPGHTGRVVALAFTPDGKRLLSAGFDKTTRLWDAATGAALCRLVGFEDGSWAVADAAGRYDASNGGDVDGLHFVVGLEPVALSQMKDRYYDPGLLGKYLGLNAEPLREVPAIRDVKLYPEVQVAAAAGKKGKFKVGLKNAGGGIGKVVVKVNGKEQTDDARPAGTNPKAPALDVDVDLSDDPRVVRGGKNTVEVLAYNADGTLASRGLVREFDDPGAPAADPPRLFAVVVGVHKYRDPGLNLQYAAKDADDFAKALGVAAERLFGKGKPGEERVTVNVLTTTQAAAGRKPTRANLLRELAALKETKPGDTVVIYLAGHGITQGGQDCDWYFLTSDARKADLAAAAARAKVTLSSAELTEFLRTIPAQKQALILDTCHSGAVVARVAQGLEVRAAERVKDRTGTHVLAGCAADAVSYEAPRYGQGLLTYSLLMGMRGAKLHDGELVDVAELFGFAADKVPELARNIGGVQRPTIASPRGDHFNIGRLTEADRARVPFHAPGPVLLPSRFLDRSAVDELDLTAKVDERLRTRSAAPKARLDFFDAVSFTGALRASGLYEVAGDKVTVQLTLSDGKNKVGPFEVKGSAAEVADKVAAEIEKRAPAPAP